MHRDNRSAAEMPKFQSEEEERQFWATHDSTLYVDWQSTQPRHLPKLKPSSPPRKVFLAERLQQERHRPAKTL